MKLPQDGVGNSTDASDVTALITVDRSLYCRVRKWEIRPEHEYTLHIFLKLISQQIFLSCQ
jgi:hypothetical protein